MSKKPSIPLISPKEPQISWQRVWVAGVVVVVVLGIGFTSLVAFANNYEERVIPNVTIGDIAVGGMTRNELTTYLESMKNKLYNDGVEIVFQTMDNKTETFVLFPTIIPNDNVIEFLEFDVDKEVDYLIGYNNFGGDILRALSIIKNRIFGSRTLLKTVSINKEELFSQIEDHLSEYIHEPKNATVHIDSLDPFAYTFVSSSAGVLFDYDSIAGQVLSSWAVLKSPSVRIDTKITPPEIVEKDIEVIRSRLPHIFSKDGLDITYNDSHTKIDTTWHISLEQLAQWIDPQFVQGNGVGFGLSHASTTDFITSTIVPKVNVDAENAKFEVGENGKVSEFLGSRPGISVDIEATYKAINEAFLQRTWHDDGLVTSVTLITSQVEPDIKTGEVNDLGISEILGVGYSNFSGSPANRISNIKHAAYDKLNGLLIKPNEEFSLLAALRPFTIAGGYLPELVIKGDKIEPEIGGGLCQIGSTMFRAAMESGMPITERRNHSLVVHYYNDPRNGLPGTDATIYENAPDFRFLNDTGHYILLTADMNVQTGELFFTLWGTNDGREGYYTEPKVLSWIPAGDTKYIETTEIPVGKEECQAKHNGAVAIFDYIRTLPNGEEEVVEYKSHYRPLPRICLVGVSAEQLDGEAVSNETENEVTTEPDMVESNDEAVPVE